MFETVGLIVFARAAGVSLEGVDPPSDGGPVAHLIRATELDGSDPCTRLANGTGVWVQIDGRDACPS